MPRSRAMGRLAHSHCRIYCGLSKVEGRPSRTRDRLAGPDGHAAYSARRSDDDVCETAKGASLSGTGIGVVAVAVVFFLAKRTGYLL